MAAMPVASRSGRSHRSKAWSLEPNLTREISRAAIIPDGVAEPLRFTLAFAATARVNGARFLPYTVGARGSSCRGTG